MEKLHGLLRWMRWMRWLALACLFAGAASSSLAAKTYSDNGDGTVTDPTTGLTWMRCSMGQTWDGTTCTGAASTYTWDQANALTGTVTFAGQGDWRVPNIRELLTIVDRTVFYQAIDSGAFPNTPTSNFWSSSPYVNYSSNAWGVYFGGAAFSDLRYNGNGVRLVRGGRSLGLLDSTRPSSDYVDQGDGTVTHTPTRLTWQRCAVGQNWTGSTCSGSASTFTWDAAMLLTSSFAGKTDWRLPTEEELVSLVDYSKFSPAINTTLFPDTSSLYFWSGSPYAGFSGNAWYLHSASGESGSYMRESKNGVRLVRGGQCFGPLVLSVSETGTGQITSSAYTGIACDTVTGATGYFTGDVVTVTANPAANLISWGGACASVGTSATCSITMDAAKTVAATFKDVPVVIGLPTALTFTAQNIGSTSPTQVVTLTNTGTAALNISSISTTGDFAVSHNCGAGIGAGGSCTLKISFTPTASGTRTGTLNLASDAPGSPHSIALNGTGQGAVASLSATALTFVSQNQGTSSAVQSITLTNTGGAVLNISSIVVSGDFDKTTSCGATLAKAATCSISVIFAPTAVGALSGSVVITSDAASSPSTITLSGTGAAGPVLSLSLTSLSFPETVVSISSAVQSIKLTNTGATALSLTSISASGDFAVTHNCGGGLGAAGFCNLSITFTPTMVGSRVGTLTIVSNAPGSPHIVSLTGTGTLGTQTIGNFSFLPATLVVGGTTTASAIGGSSGNPVTFTSLTTDTCTTSGTNGSTVRGTAVGACSIAANQAGNAYYPEASQATKGITVIAAATPMVAAGHAHNVAVKTDGTVLTWGSNFYGELGDGTQTQRSLPAPVPGLSGVTAVAAGTFYTLALKSDGTVEEWGTNGNNTNSSHFSPVVVSGLSGAVALAVGTGGHAVALKADGTVAAWGYNAYGQLGDGTKITRYRAEVVPGLNGVVAVAAGYGHTVALKSDGTVAAWGFNIEGQLGDGTKLDQLTPVAVPGLTGVVALVACEYCTIALKSDGNVVTIGPSTARILEGLTGVSVVATGGSHNVALRADGTAMVWGDNGFGQFGDGTTISSPSPAKVPDLSGVTTIDAGVRHTVALKVDGSVWAWGWNAYGQVGDGSTTQRNSPVEITGSRLGTGTSPALLSRSSLSFATQNVGASSAAQSLTLTNTGSIPLYIPVITVAGSDYSRTTTCGFTLAAGANCSIAVTFTPTAAGTRNGVLAIVSNGVILNSVSLNGNSSGPVVSLASILLSFGAENLGSTSTAQSVTLSNTGNLALNISSIAASGDYGVTHNCGNGLGAGGFCTLNITFAPKAKGARTGTVSIINDAYNSPQQISLTGTGQGAVVSLSAPSKTFASQNMGTTSAAQIVTLTNTGGDVLNIASIGASGDFAQSNTCGATLAKSAICAISITFSPTAAGARTGSVVITSDATSSPNTIALDGAGVAVPVVSLNPAAVTFIAQNVGSTSAAQTVTLTNSGGATLSLTSITTSGDFAVAHNCGSGLGPAGFCNLSVTFAPTVAGNRVGILTIASNAPGSSYTVALSGSTPASASNSLDLLKGWNLLGNGQDQTLPVTTLFGDPLNVTTVWKWDVTQSGWQFYAPSMDAAALQTYTTSKGYGVLSNINPGEGFWVNAVQAFTVSQPSGTAIVGNDFSAGKPYALKLGWNLVATGSDVTPSAFNTSLSATPPSPGSIPINLTTLWAWDNPLSQWYFYAPSFEAQGGTAQIDYVTSKGYLDFTQHNKPLGNGVGFWVNRP